MNDLSLLNELELKIREMVSALEREKSRNLETKNSIQESSKLSEIEEKVNKQTETCQNSNLSKSLEKSEEKVRETRRKSEK